MTVHYDVCDEQQCNYGVNKFSHASKFGLTFVLGHQ